MMIIILASQVVRPSSFVQLVERKVIEIDDRQHVNVFESMFEQFLNYFIQHKNTAETNKHIKACMQMGTYWKCFGAIGCRRCLSKWLQQEHQNANIWVWQQVAHHFLLLLLLVKNDWMYNWANELDSMP